MNSKNKRLFDFKLCLVLAAAVLLLQYACLDEKQSKEPKELLIFCGETMIKPMAELATIFEQKHDCKIIITKGGSGNLLRSIKANRIGDLYLPGSDSYIKACIKEDLITNSIPVGENRAAMMVLKDNPKKITPDLSQLASPEHYVVLGNPISGSIGKETRAILNRRGIFDQVMANVKSLTTDSKDLIKMLKEKKADLVINWYATAVWPENRDFVQILPISPAYATSKRLVLGQLASSYRPDLARQFLSLAGSIQGREIFEKYGFAGIQQ